ncbi:MAG: cation:proton antiporter [Proteobacteria bacterium]|nr:cation:proton antiporter [Pseudomonadota bacterium]MDE3208751.1 cation:proton antiporter [Pseudomonadota bacterium]
MTSLWLPHWPLQNNNFLTFGIILITGLIGGALAHRIPYLPRLSGFLLIGFFLGPGFINLFQHDLIQQAQPFVHVALALIVFELGRQLDLKSLRPGLVAISLAESALTFGLIYFILIKLGIPPLVSALAAAIGVSSSPAVVLLVMREYQASGDVTSRNLDLVALNNIFSFLIFTALQPAALQTGGHSLETAIGLPLYQMGIAIVQAYLVAKIMLFILHHLETTESGQFCLLVGTIIVSVGLSQLMNSTMLFTLLSLGIFSRNLDKQEKIIQVGLGHAQEAFYIIMFVIAGASLHLNAFLTYSLMGASFVVCRFIAKSSLIMGGSRLMGLNIRQGMGLSLTLIPMAGMAIGLLNQSTRFSAQIHDPLSAIVLSAIAVLEVIGPIVTVAGLKLAGEIERARF